SSLRTSAGSLLNLATSDSLCRLALRSNLRSGIHTARWSAERVICGAYSSASDPFKSAHARSRGGVHARCVISSRIYATACQCVYVWNNHLHLLNCGSVFNLLTYSTIS